MTQTHTAGPWTVECNAPGVYGIYGPDGEFIAQTLGERSDKECEANAFRLRAALELLEALKYARRFLNAADHDVLYVDLIIAKAEAEGSDR